MKDKANPSLATILRQKAEDLLKNKSITTDAHFSDIDIIKLIHELDIHQVELEMQNEELLLAKKKLEINAEKYTNLYDFAPSGYFTLSKEGDILEINFRGANLLGKERTLLLNNRFALFVSDETRPKFNLFLEEIFESKTRQTCELILSIIPKISTYVYLSGIVSDDDKQCIVTMHDISQRKKAEEATKISEEKYRTLFETNRDSITIFRIDKNDKPGNFIEVNPSTTTLFGYTKKELMALSVRDIETISDKKRKSRIETLLNKGRIDFETIIKNKKGNLRNVEIETILINYLNEPAVMNITRDITERKQTEDNIRKAQENLATILEAIPDLLFEVDLEGRIYHYQAHREDLLAVPASAFMGRLVHETLPVDAANIILKAIEEANKKGWSVGKQYSLDLSQGKHWFELSVSTIKENSDKDKHFILLARDITERKIAEIYLDENKQNLQSIFDSVDEAIYVMDESGTFIDVNKGAEKMYSCSKQDLIGKSPQTVAAPGLNDLDKIQKIIQKVFKTGNPIQFEFWAERKNGEIFPKEVVINKGKYSGKNVLIAAARDITERKKAEEALQKSQEKLRGVFDLANSGIILTDLKGKYLLFNNWCTDALGYTREEMNKLTREDLTHPDDLENSNLIFNKLVTGKIDRYQIEKRYLRKDKSFFWAEVSVSAIKDKNNKVVNTIGILNDITEQRNAKVALQESEEKLRSIFDTANSGIILTDLKGSFILYNNWCEKMFGYTNPEMQGMTIFDISHPDDVEKSKKALKEIINGKRDKFQLEKRFIKKDKSVFWGEISVSAVKDKGNKVVSTMGIITDITERRNAEIALKENEKKLLGIFNVANSGIMMIDAKNKFILFNDWCCDILGYTREEFSNLSSIDTTYPDDYNQTKLLFDKLNKGEIDKFKIEKRYLRKDKSFFWGEISASSIKDENNMFIYAVGIITDITERRNAKIALQESEARLIAAQAVAKIGSWETDFTFTNVIWSKENGKIFGLNPDVTKLSLEEFLSIVHPEDRTLVETTFVHSIKTNTVNSLEHRIITAAGVEKIVEQRWEILRDDQGQPLRAIGTSQDITERKLIQQKLIESESRFSSIINSSPVAMAINDEQNNITYLNQAFVDMFGYTLEDIPTVLDWFPKVYPEPEYRKKITAAWATELEKVKQTGVEFIPMEAIIRCKNGSDRTVLVSANPLLHSFDSEYLINFYDITERKLAEEKLIEKEYRLQTILSAEPECVKIVDAQGILKSMNSAGLKMLEAESQDQVIGKPVLGVIAPEYHKSYIEMHNKVLKGESARMEFEMISLKGNRRWVETSAIPFQDNGETVQLAVTRDITDHKLAEAKLIANENFLNQTQIIANLGSYSLDFTTGKWTSTAILDNIFGIDANFVRTIDGWKSIIHPEWQTIMNDYLNNEVIDKKVNFNKEYKIIKVDSKEERWVHGIGEIAFNKQNQPLKLIGSIQDITERKLADEKLKLSSEKFQDLVNSTGGIVWEADAKTFNFTYVSKQAERLLGHPVKDWQAPNFWADHLHPEDKDHTIEYCISRTKQMEAHDFTYRFRARDGHYVWLRDIVNVIIEEGKPRWLRGVMFDISKQKETIESLRESEEKYRGLVENSPDGIVIYSDDKIAFINDEGLRMLGTTSRENVIGKSVLQFIHPDSLSNVIKRMEEVVLDNNASATVEERFLDINGVPFDVEIKAIPTIYDHKEAVQVIVHDITKRKQTTTELNKINRVYALISQINNLILRSKDRDELFQEICHIAVTYGKFRMSWIGILDEDSKTINTAAFSGFEEGYFTKDSGITILDEPGGRGPTGTAMREGRTVICNDIANDTIMEKWRKGAIQRGYRSSISIPIIVLNKIIGSFNLYSEESNSFSSTEEIELLEKITQNIAFTLEKILIEEDRKRTEEKIRQLSQAVEQSPVTIVITNTKGEIEYANPKFVETTGYTLEEVMGQNPRVLKSGYTSSGEYNELWQTIATGKEWHGEFHNKKKDGTLFWESASISPIVNSEGKTTHYIAIKEDITHRKNVEKELVKSKERAEESDRLKLAFLANMSHEIRTPMNGILGFTELLKEPKLSGDEQQEYINIIEKSGKRMLNIINDIISISKVESGQIEVSLSETNVNEQIEYIHTFFKPEAKQKGIQLNISKKLSAKETLIKTDREKVYAILTNLVKNALKFTNEGYIELGCVKKEKNLEFYVKDTGLGISPSQKKIIFERFRQANETISRNHEGSGLGLAISKAYVEMLGGKIWVESEEGKGSTFYFTIPFYSEYKREEKIVVEKVGSGINLENKIKDLKVLIVEDDAISKLLITIAVKPYSKEILKVSTGFEAIDACRNNPDIDLVMMDINMPEMGGYEATKQIREFNKDLVIIAQTANGMQSDRDDAIAAGCTDYISKPINITTLGELIQRYFKK